VVAGLAARRDGSPAGPVAAACLLVAAVALGPVPAARPWAALLAGGTVLLASGVGRWAALALAPGTVAIAVATADVPAVGDPSPLAHGAFAAGLVVAAAALAIAVGPTEAAGPDDPGPIALEAKAAVAVLTGWLVLAPGSWRWAVADPHVLDAWDRAAAVGGAAALVAWAGARIAARPDRARGPAAQ
jgi:hypothetical protein